MVLVSVPWICQAFPGALTARGIASATLAQSATTEPAENWMEKRKLYCGKLARHYRFSRSGRSVSEQGVSDVSTITLAHHVGVATSLAPERRGNPHRPPGPEPRGTIPRRLCHIVDKECCFDEHPLITTRLSTEWRTDPGRNSQAWLQSGSLLQAPRRWTHTHILAGTLRSLFIGWTEHWLLPLLRTYGTGC